MAPVTHVVLVQWRPGTNAETVVEARRIARGLSDEIPGIEGLVEGPSNSIEGLENGFDYGLVIRFKDDAARDAYLPHPAHLPLANALRANADRLVVFDIAGPDGPRRHPRPR